MAHEITIRPETDDDHAAIGAVITEAFAGMPYADGDEAQLVEALRRESAISLSLVADLDGTVIGQVVLSPALAADGTGGWYALGPVAVAREHQRAGIGSRLIGVALDVITQRGANGCILVGNPAYYRRFGFELSPRNAPVGEPAEFFMVKLLSDRKRPRGAIAFHPAFASGA